MPLGLYGLDRIKSTHFTLHSVKAYFFIKGLILKIEWLTKFITNVIFTTSTHEQTHTQNKHTPVYNGQPNDQG